MIVRDIKNAERNKKIWHAFQQNKRDKYKFVSEVICKADSSNSKKSNLVKYVLAIIISERFLFTKDLEKK